MNNKFALRYMPTFEYELAASRDYIANILKNPVAALRLVSETENAILKRLENPLSYKPYHSKKDRKQPYYCIYIKNYIVFYVVIGNIMEVRRFIYSKRNLEKLV